MTTDEGTRAAAAITRLRVAIEQTALALAQPDVDRLLAGESELEVALAELPAVVSLSPDERRAVRVEVDAAQRALRRCRRLGSSLDMFVRISIEAQGRSEYGPRQSKAPYAAQALDARV